MTFYRHADAPFFAALNALGTGVRVKTAAYDKAAYVKAAGRLDHLRRAGLTVDELAATLPFYRSAKRVHASDLVKNKALATDYGDDLIDLLRREGKLPAASAPTPSAPTPSTPTPSTPTPDPAAPDGGRSWAPWALGGTAALGIPAAGAIGYGAGRTSAEDDSKRRQYMAFGGGLAAGVGAPKLISGAQAAIGRMQGTPAPAARPYSPPAVQYNPYGGM